MKLFSNNKITLSQIGLLSKRQLTICWIFCRAWLTFLEYLRFGLLLLILWIGSNVETTKTNNNAKKLHHRIVRFVGSDYPNMVQSGECVHTIEIPLTVICKDQVYKGYVDKYPNQDIIKLSYKSLLVSSMLRTLIGYVESLCDPKVCILSQKNGNKDYISNLFENNGLFIPPVNLNLSFCRVAFNNHRIVGPLIFEKADNLIPKGCTTDIGQMSQSVTKPLDVLFKNPLSMGDWDLAFAKYKNDRKLCLSQPPMLGTCLCNVNLRFQKWCRIEQNNALDLVVRIDLARYEIAKNKFLYIREFCDQFSKIIK